MFNKSFKAILLVTLLLLASVINAAQTVTYFHNDISGSPLMASDAGGNVVWKENYYPYGERLKNQEGQSVASINNKLWFTGKPYDEYTGLSYLGARYYNPVLGRFMGIDPADVDIGNIHSFNRYAYANNNPYRYVDPDGHSPLDIGFLVYDIGKAAVAIYTGQGVGMALADVAMSAIGVVSPIPGTGQALKAAKIVKSSQNWVGVASAAILKSGVTKKSDNFVDLASSQRRKHILEGDATGGGHRPGTGIRDKSEFPQGWSDDKIMHEISDVATDPNLTTRIGRGGRTITEGVRDGINIRVIKERTGNIVTGYPTNVPRNK